MGEMVMCSLLGFVETYFTCLCMTITSVTRNLNAKLLCSVRISMLLLQGEGKNMRTV